MPRILFTLLAASVLLSAPLAAGASPAGVRPTGAARVTTTAAATVVLRGRQGIDGPWRRSLRLKLVRSGVPTSFSVCAVWDQAALTADCTETRGQALPQEAVMRLEQRRSAGWRTVALSTEAVLETRLSNAVAGNRLGVVTYRVRVRNPSGLVLRTSNTFKVTWHK